MITLLILSVVLLSFANGANDNFKGVAPSGDRADHLSARHCLGHWLYFSRSLAAIIAWQSLGSEIQRSKTGGQQHCHSAPFPHRCGARGRLHGIAGREAGSPHLHNSFQQVLLSEPVLLPRYSPTSSVKRWARVSSCHFSFHPSSRWFSRWRSPLPRSRNGSMSRIIQFRFFLVEGRLPAKCRLLSKFPAY